MAQLVFAPPVKLADGRYFVKMSNADNSRIFKQLNNCKMVGPSCYEVPVDLSSYDSMIIDQATSSSEAWFGKVIPAETLKNMYETSITSNVFEATLMKVKGKCVTVVFNQDKEEVSIDELKDGCTCNLMVELSGIWFLKKNFGPIWRVAQARLVNSEKVVPRKYMFEDDTQGDDQDLEDFS